MNIALETIEKDYDFEYPALYKKLAENQLLYSGEPSADWLMLTFPKYKDNPPLLLFGQDFELLTTDEIREEIKTMQDPDDYREINPDYLFVPFGRTAAGDLYCFWYHFPDEIATESPLIVLLWHDDNLVDVLAKNLEDFIFRELVSAVCDVFSEGLVMQGDFKTNIANMLRTHSPFLSERKAKIISEIYSRDWFSYSYKVSYGKGEQTAEGLITYDEMKALLQQEIGFEYLDQSFEYEVVADKKPKVVLHKISGMVYLKHPLISEPKSPVLQVIKELNWRQDKAITTHLQYSKKYEVYSRFTTDKERFAEMLTPFLPRLKKLKTLTDFELIFVDEVAGKETDLFELI